MTEFNQLEDSDRGNFASAVYDGSIRHRRFTPRTHNFSYQFMQWWLALDELEQVAAQSQLLSLGDHFAPLQFRPSDYLRGQWGDAATLQSAVLNKFNQLNAEQSGEPLLGRVFFLGNLRCWGLYFSPINCYFLQQDNGMFSHMLAEVSNTPWRETHYYLIDLNTQKNTDKAMHVSPFNPMDMVYHWKINQPDERMFVHIEAHRQDNKVFDATMALKRNPLNRQEIRNVLRTYPAMTLKIVSGIYWQALRLFFKRVPFVGHPESSEKSK